MILYVVRHGESEANSKGIIGANLDLTSKGREQIEGLVKELASVHVGAIFSSPLIRCVNSAKIIANEKELENITIEGLRERNFGEYEGVKVDDYKNYVKDLVPVFESLNLDERIKFKFYPTYESGEEVIKRFLKVVKETSEKYFDKTVVMVTSGSLMRMFLWSLKIHATYVDNAGYIKLETDGVNFKVQEMSKVEIFGQDTVENEST